MSKVFFSIALFTCVVWANPYKTLDVDTQLSIMVNYFIGEQIKKELPEKPVKQEYIAEEVDLNPGKYERYYNYIQRLKAIEQTKKEALAKIEEKFRGKASYYNGKLHSIRSSYEDKKKLEPLLQEALNNAFKVVFGKPIIQDFQMDGSFAGATLSALPLYQLENSLKLKVLFDPKLFNQKLEDRYYAEVTFEKKEYTFVIDTVSIEVDGKKYKGKIKNKNNATFKLNVKINDDIFQKIKLEDKE